MEPAEHHADFTLANLWKQRLRRFVLVLHLLHVATVADAYHEGIHQLAVWIMMLLSAEIMKGVAVALVLRREHHGILSTKFIDG